MYKVPMKIPKYCTKCPFGICVYHQPLTTNKRGYICNVDYAINGKYTKTIEGECNKEIKRPEWCKLIEIK